MGAFTVGGHGSLTAADHCAARDWEASLDSVWGGAEANYAEGRNRSIVDITGPFCAYDLADLPNSSMSPNDDYSAECGTSYASPLVMGAAASFIDMYKHELGNSIDDPGALFVRLLLLGDRTHDTLSSSSHDVDSDGRDDLAYDHHSGAGKLQLRMLNETGMDAPWFFEGGWTCISQGETKTIPLNGGSPISTDIDSILAVAWWYDEQGHSSSLTIDNIDMKLRRNGVASALRTSADAYDEKERVFVSNPSGGTWDMQLLGPSVHNDTSGCGPDSMKVYFAVLAEDGDRDDPDGPSYNAACEGVSPQ